MQEPAERALRLLDVLARQSGKEERSTELLRDPDSGATPGWSFHVPSCFNDALDVRQTQRKVGSKAVTTWTQGPNFAFHPGDVLYDTTEAYGQWAVAMTHICRCLQVKAATPKTSGADGGTSGTVTFDLLKPTDDRKALAFEASHSLSQEAFVRFLITGRGLSFASEQ